MWLRGRCFSPEAIPQGDSISKLTRGLLRRASPSSQRHDFIFYSLSTSLQFPSVFPALIANYLADAGVCKSQRRGGTWIKLFRDFFFVFVGLWRGPVNQRAI